MFLNLRGMVCLSKSGDITWNFKGLIIKLIKELDSVYEINEEVEWFVTFDKKVTRTIY